MKDTDKEKILYHPKLRPERDYLSNGEIIDFPLVSLQPPEEIDDTPKKIVEDIKEIEEIYHLLPADVQNMRESITKIKQRIIVAFPDGTFSSKLEQPDKPASASSGTLPDIINYYDTAINDNPDLISLPNLFPQMNNVMLKVEQPKTLVQIIQEAYSRDQIELERYYIQKLQMIMQRYFQQMMAIMADSGVSSLDDLTKDFDGDFVQVPENKDLDHLRDFIVRSQVRRNQVSRMFHKTHSTDKTLMHMRSWHAANEQRKRYYSEKYKDSSTFTDSHSNSLLRESRSSYDTAYNSSLYDMYKYLNSSAVLTNDILDSTVKEAQAKAELMKNDVDIYATDQSEAEFAKHATDSGQLGDGKGSGFDEAAKKNNKENKDSDSTEKKVDQASDAQYENDLKYLMSKGYDKATADAELAKLPQYKDRFSKKDGEQNKAEDKESSTSSQSTSTSDIWNDLAAEALKNPLGIITSSISGDKKHGGTAVADTVSAIVSSIAQKTVNKVEKHMPKTLATVSIEALVQENYNSTKTKITSEQDQSKYPESDRIDIKKDDAVTQKKKRVNQLKQDITTLDNQIASINKMRKETGKYTLKHNELVKANYFKSKLMDELKKLSS